MFFSGRWRAPLIGIAGALLACAPATVVADTAAAVASTTSATPATTCRIAFDLGSSGIRAGATGSTATPRTDIDYLPPLWAGQRMETLAAPTIAALQALPEKGGFAPDCARAAAGFSAWRLALRQEGASLGSTLARIHAASGVAVLIVPQSAEGRYAYAGAQQQLGARLNSSHVVDIGGGSLQVAGEGSSFGAELGQKAWHRTLCQSLRQTTDIPCRLQPMSAGELQRARTLLAERLGGIGTALPDNVTLTAISRPVTRGVHPALLRLNPRREQEAAPDRTAIRQSDLAAAIARLSEVNLEETAALVDLKPSRAAYLLSDLLLVQGLLTATGSDTLHVAEADITNLPGLLADDRAFAWSRRYTCYLARVAERGLAAYDSDPGSCPDEPGQRK